MPIQFDDTFWNTRWTTAHGARDQIKGALLAAGLGRRLDPLTSRHLPKPMFPLGGKVPILEMWVRRLIESGITNVSMNICVHADTIKRYFGDGSKFGINLKFIEEQTPTGTLGGISKQAMGNEAKRLPSDEPQSNTPKFSGSTIIAPSGDIVTDFGSDLLEAMYETHRREGAALSMIVTRIPDHRRKDFGTILLDSQHVLSGPLSLSGKISGFVEKDPNSPSTLSNASIYMIEMELLEALDEFRTEASLEVEEPFYDFGKHVFPALLGELPYAKLPKNYPMWAIQYDGGWFDVGSKRDYLEVNKHLLDEKITVPLRYEKLPWGYLGSNVAIDFSKVEIHPPAIIGNDCIIEPDVILGPYAVIGDGWRIEKGSTIKNSVLWERYSYFDNQGAEVSAADRSMVDRHEVMPGVSIDNSIVAGGTIQEDAIEKTVDVHQDGRTEMLSIDYVPAGPRA